MAAVFGDVGTYRVAGPFADLTPVQVDSAHAGLRCEVDEVRAQFLYITGAQVELLFGQDHDAAPFRRLVGQRGELRGVGQFLFTHAGGMQEATSLAVAEGDGAGLVEQQHVDVTRRFHSASRSGDDVLR